MIIQGGSDFVEIEVVTSPSSAYAQEGFVECLAKVRVERFSAQFSVYAHIGEFRGFYKELMKLDQELVKQVEFQAISGELYLKGTLQADGNIQWQGKASGMQHNLEFELETDSWSVKRILPELKEIVNEYQANNG